MADVPVLDWRCTKCGGDGTWRLVKPEPGQQAEAVINSQREIPTLDWTCARCGTTNTWQLVRTT